jgi:hypothetical protein
MFPKWHTEWGKRLRGVVTSEAALSVDSVVKGFAEKKQTKGRLEGGTDATSWRIVSSKAGPESHRIPVNQSADS